VARKKRQALDSLLSVGKISQSTHGIFNKEIDDAISEIEKQQKALLEKMAAKVVELEGQVKTLEILLANFEIRHVTGEIGDDVYERESELFAAGLDTAKHELDEVKEAADQLATGELTIEEEIEQQPQEENAAPQPEEKLLEEAAPIAEDDNVETNEEPVVETVTCTEVTASEVNAEREQQS
jgi:CdvA-like coiled-coil domain